MWSASVVPYETTLAGGEEWVAIDLERDFGFGKRKISSPDLGIAFDLRHGCHDQLRQLAGKPEGLLRRLLPCDLLCPRSGRIAHWPDIPIPFARLLWWRSPRAEVP
jgi:hypothetical protein